MGWPAVYATNHRYRVHWGEGLDFETMKWDVATDIFGPDDGNVHFVTNFTDVRVYINVSDSNWDQIMNETYTTKSEDELLNGDNVIYNQTEVREFHFVVNGKDGENRSTITMEGWRCDGPCEENAEVVEEVDLSGTPIPWSDPNSWESGAVPVDGEDVEIPPGVWIVLDINETAVLNKLTINGRLSF